MTKPADKEAKKLLEEFDVFDDAEYGKVRCRLTGHELKPTGAALKEYTSTRKFQIAWAVHKIVSDHPDVFEDLDEHFIGCKCTKKVLARDADTLQRHLDGKKFKRALAKGLTGDEQDDEPSAQAESDSGNSDVDMASDDEEEVEDEDEEEEEESDSEEDYPELAKKEKAVPAEADSYDFSVMDTEVEAKGTKRKTPGKGAADKKKRVRKV